MSRVSLFFGVLVLVPILAIGQYPTTFPYEDESLIPPTLVDETPSQTYDDKDPGGYAKTGFVEENLDDCWIGFPWSPNCYGGWNHLFYTFWQLTANQPANAMPKETFNCTAQATPIYFAASDFPGTLGSMKAECDGSQCCPGWVGLRKFGEDQLEKQEGMASLYSSSGCPDPVPEPVYCGIGDSSVHACMEFYTSKKTRSVMIPCPQVSYSYYMSCTLFSSVGMGDDAEVQGTEPASYVAKLSKEQTMYVKAVINLHEHLCLPLTYYGVEEAGGDDSSGMTASFALSAVILLATQTM